MAPRSTNSNPNPTQQQERLGLGLGDPLRHTEDSCCSVMAQRRTGRREGGEMRCPTASSLCFDRLPPFPAASTGGIALEGTCKGKEGAGEGVDAAGAPHVSRKPHHDPVRAGPHVTPRPLHATSRPPHAHLLESQVLVSRGPSTALLTSGARHTPPRSPHARWTLLSACLLLLHLLSGVPSARAHVQGEYLT